MATRAFSRSKFAFFSSILLQNLKTTPIKATPMLLKPTELELESWRSIRGLRLYHEGRPRGPLWRGKKLIGKEALFVISGLKRFEDDEEKLGKFVNTLVLRLLKMDMIVVLTELDRQEEVALAIKVFNVIRKQDWYKPDVYLYEDLIIALTRSKKMEDVMLLWDSMKKEDLFPYSQIYTEVIRGFLNYGCPADAMNIYEDMKQSPDPPEEVPFRILLKGLLPHPLLRNTVKQDIEELFPDSMCTILRKRYLACSAEVELLAIREGLMLAMHCGFLRVQVEMDSLEAVEACKGVLVELSNIGFIVSDIQELLVEFLECTKLYIPHECNSVAHCLAKSSLVGGVSVSWFEEPFDVDVIRELLDHEMYSH